MSIEAEHEEVLQFIESNKLMGKGLGYVDFHLIASSVLMGIAIWTLDKKLKRIANMLCISHKEEVR
jgi:hypothetical protein